MNINVSPPRTILLVEPNGSLKRRTINVSIDQLLEATSISDKSKKVTAKDSGLSCNGPQSDVHWTPTTRKKKKKSKIRPQYKIRERETNKIDITRRDGTKVCFRTDENNDVVQEYANVPMDHYLTKEEIGTCWWTKKELLEIKEHANQICRFYMKERPKYKAAVLRTLERCGAHRTGNELDIITVFDISESDEDDDISTLVDGDTRGLEKRMILSMILPFHRHKRSIHATLDTQKRLRAIDPAYFTSNQRVRLLATQYGLNAGYATKWAHKIALGDARGVTRNFTFDW
jgi:hypothetical protein